MTTPRKYDKRHDPQRNVAVLAALHAGSGGMLSSALPPKPQVSPSQSKLPLPVRPAKWMCAIFSRRKAILFSNYVAREPTWFEKSRSKGEPKK